VEKAGKEMRDEKVTGIENVPGDVLNLLGEDGLGILAQLINNMYETGQWPKNFTKVRMTALKKQKATKCGENCTTSLMAHTGKIAVYYCKVSRAELYLKYEFYTPSLPS
jgi:hypothetical protein